MIGECETLSDKEGSIRLLNDLVNEADTVFPHQNTGVINAFRNLDVTLPIFSNHMDTFQGLILIFFHVFNSYLKN